MGLVPCTNCFRHASSFRKRRFVSKFLGVFLSCSEGKKLVILNSFSEHPNYNIAKGQCLESLEVQRFNCENNPFLEVLQSLSSIPYHRGRKRLEGLSRKLVGGAKSQSCCQIVSWGHFMGEKDDTYEKAPRSSRDNPMKLLFMWCFPSGYCSVPNFADSVSG